MPLQFAVDQSSPRDDAQLFAVRGELDLATTPLLLERLDSAIDGGLEGVVVDLRDCDFIDSAGIALLMFTWRRLTRRPSGGLSIVCEDGAVLRTLELTEIHTVIPIRRTPLEALVALTDR